LQKTLEVSAELTGADKGSLFLVDKRGAVTDSILTRVDPTPEQRSKIIGQVFDEGLAGWVRRNRKIGLIFAYPQRRSLGEPYQSALNRRIRIGRTGSPW